MKRAIVLALLTVLALPAAASAAPYVVTLRDSVVDVDQTVNGLQKDLKLPATSQRYAVALKGFSIDLTDAQVAKLRANPAVAFVQPDVAFTATAAKPAPKPTPTPTPTPTATPTGTPSATPTPTPPPAPAELVPPGVRRLGPAHAAATGAVAVLDTGVDLANTDLNVVSGTNCVKPGTAAMDDNGHGTNVAGIVAARSDGNGVVGVAPGTRVYAVKVLNNRASGTLSQFLCGINWVAANAASLGIKVANMSVAGSGKDDGNCGNTHSDAEHKAIGAAAAAGVTFVVSAGNSGVDFANSIPAAYKEVLTVTAMTDTDGLPGGLGAASCSSGNLDDRSATYSSFAVSAASMAHAIAAPGTCVVSDGIGGATSTYTGTSQAAPHVAGAVALCLGSAGLPGPCAGLAPADVIAKVRADATAADTLASGFAGDPLRPLSGKLFGPLVSTAAY